jgi:hypothetical protein
MSELRPANDWTGAEHDEQWDPCVHVLKNPRRAAADQPGGRA